MPRNFKDFSRPSYREMRWLETQWTGFWTEAGMRVHLWTGFRINQEVATTKVFAVSEVAETVLDMDYCDQQYHIPMGSARLSDFSLMSGLSQKGHPAPKEFTVQYRSFDGRLKIDVEATSMMEPVNLAFTEMAGATKGFVGFHHRPDPGPEDRAGLEPSGHVDYTVYVKGDLVIDGEHQKIDGVGQRDHSWSPRMEYNHSPGNWENIHFGEELTLLGQTVPRPDGTSEVTHGYVLRGREPRRLREASVVYERDGFRTRRFQYDVTDETGERYLIEGEQRSGFEIDMGPNIYISFDQFDCQWDGRTGFGETQFHHEIMKLQRERRAARKARAGVPIAG